MLKIILAVIVAGAKYCSCILYCHIFQYVYLVGIFVIDNDMQYKAAECIVFVLTAVFRRGYAGCDR